MTWLSGPVFLPVVALSSCFVLLGCSKEGKRTEVHGMVTVKGQTPNIQGLRISFIGSDNRSVTARVGLNGEYTVNVLGGDNLVVVSWQPPDDQNAFQSGQPKEFNSPIPPRYAHPATSGLKCTIEADTTNTYNVDLSD